MNHRCRRIVLAGLVSLLGCRAAGAQVDADLPPQAAPSTQALVFGAVASDALIRNFDLLSQLSAHQAQERAARSVSAGLLPRLDIHALSSYERVEQIDTNRFSDPYRGRGGRSTLTLRLPLYDGGAIRSEAQRQGRLGNVQYFEFRQAEDLLILELARAWIDIDRQRALIRIDEANVAAHEQLFRLVRGRVKSGVSRGIDIDQANSRLSSARLALASDQGLLADALARFRRIAMFEATTSLTPITIPPTQLPAGEREVIEDAMTHSYLLRAAAERVATAEAALSAQRAAHAPKLSFEAWRDLYGRSSEYRRNESTGVQLSLNVNLYAGGGDQARIQDAALRHQAARQQFQDGVGLLLQDVSATWAEAFRQAHINDNARAYVEAVTRTRDVYRVQFEIGQRSLLDLLNTENEVAQAQRAQVDSTADLTLARIRLLALAGRLPPAFAIQRTSLQPLLAPAPDPIDARALVGSMRQSARSGGLGGIVDDVVGRVATPP